MSLFDLNQWPQHALTHDGGMESRAQMLRRRVAAYRCYLAAGTDINIVRQILREIATDEAELAALLKDEASNTHPRPGPSITEQG